MRSFLAFIPLLFLPFLAFLPSRPALAQDRPGAFALPNADLTPGVVGPATAQTLCKSRHVQVASTVSAVDATAVFKRYGLSEDQWPSYVIDHLVPADLGGTDDPGNLWPELTVGPLNHADKVKVEERLRGIVCAGRLPLSTAQAALRASWVDAYERYVGPYP